MPTRNFQASWTPPEIAQGVFAQTSHNRYYVRNYACYRCSVAYGQMAEVKDGDFASARSRPEYESIGMLGLSCGIYDMAAVIAARELCDSLGLDTITAGNLVAMPMELYERGLMTAADNDGLVVRFGDARAQMAMLRYIAEGRCGLGGVIAAGANGILAAHPEWRPDVQHTKGLTFPAYEPRGFYGMGLAYTTSARGACHNVGGYTVSAELLSRRIDRYAVKGKGELVMELRDNRANVDSTGICTVVRGAYDLSASPKAIR